MQSSTNDADQAASQAFLRDAAKPAARLVGLASGAGLLDALASVAFAAGLAGAVSRLPANTANLAPWLGLVATAMLARAGLGRLRLRLAASGAQQVKSALRQRILAAALHVRPGRSLAGETTAAVVDDVEAIDGYVVRYLPARILAGAAPMIILAAAALASPIAAALMLATLVPFIALMILAGSAAAVASRRQLDALARLSGVFADRVRALPLLLAFQAEGRAADQVAASSRQVSGRTLQVLRIAFISSAGLEFFAALSVALVAIYAGFRLLGLVPFPLPGRLTFEHAFFVLALAPEFYAPMRQLAAAYHERQLGEAAAARLRMFLALPVAPPPSAVELQGPPSVRFHLAEVGFADDRDLRIGPVSFEAAPGSITALMGPTGSGKTTLLRLLVGEAALVGGSVAVGGHSLAGAGSFARSIAWAGQAPAILPGSLGFNIALAAPGAARGRVERAAIDAGLTEVLDRRGGLDLPLNERGSRLSGGERRRIGLARAFLKNAPILLLDEPTADLDPASEASMIAALKRAARGRTVLIATHSQRVAAMADQVIVL